MSSAELSRSPGCLIEARDVVKSFGQTPALRGASVSAAAGEIIAIMGPSGSGKSTLLHCMAGIFKPDSGQVLFDGTRLDELGETKRTELRRTAGDTKNPPPQVRRSSVLTTWTSIRSLGRQSRMSHNAARVSMDSR